MSVTVLEAVKSKIFMQDVVTFFRMMVNAIWFLISKDFEIAIIAAKVSGNIHNHMAANIIYWIIVCLICIASIAVVGLIFKLAGEKVMDYYSENPPDYITVTIMMVSLTVMIFLGEQIKRLCQSICCFSYL